MNPIFLLGAAAFGFYWFNRSQTDDDQKAAAVSPPVDKAKFKPRAALAEPVFPNPCFNRVKRSEAKEPADLIPGP